MGKIDNITAAILCTEWKDSVEKTISSCLSIGLDVLLVGHIQEGINLEGLSFLHYSWEKDFSKARNRIQSEINTPWVLHIDSDEVLDPSSRSILRKIGEEKKIYRVAVRMENSQIMVPRLVPSDIKWTRPAYEIPISDYPLVNESRIVISHISEGVEKSREKSLYNSSLLEGEIKRTGDPDLIFLAAVNCTFSDLTKAYYFASMYLNNFASSGSEKGRRQALWMEYVLAYTDGLSKRDLPGAVRRLRSIIAKAPQYAEFWCLLGDFYLLLQSPIQAKEMYENSIAIGMYTSFLQEDRPWVDIEKYDEYPKGRINQCDRIIEEYYTTHC